MNVKKIIEKSNKISRFSYDPHAFFTFIFFLQRKCGYVRPLSVLIPDSKYVIYLLVGQKCTMLRLSTGLLRGRIVAYSSINRRVDPDRWRAARRRTPAVMGAQLTALCERVLNTVLALPRDTWPT